MSLVKVAGNASGTGTITIQAPNTNSDYTLTLPAATGNILTSATTTGFPAGSVLQVVSVAPTGTGTVVSSNTFTDITGFSASITPSSTSNKVLIMVNVNAYVVSNANGWGFQITDGSNNVIVEPLPKDSNGPFGYYISGADGSSPQYGSQFSYQYLWSPSTTSATTVKLKGRPYNSSIGSVYFNYVGSASAAVGSLILMEIAG